MKTLTIAIVALFAPLAVWAQPAGKLGSINIQSAMTSTLDGQRATQELARKMDPRKKAIDAKAQQIRELQDKLQRGGAAMSEAAKADLTRQIDERTRSYNRDMEDAQAELSDEQRKLIGDLSDKMTKIIDKYAQDNGFTIIFDVSNPQTPVLYTANVIDITRDVIALYDKAHPAQTTQAGPSPAPAAVKKQP